MQLEDRLGLIACAGDTSIEGPLERLTRWKGRGLTPVTQRSYVALTHDFHLLVSSGSSSFSERNAVSIEMRSCVVSAFDPVYLYAGLHSNSSSDAKSFQSTRSAAASGDASGPRLHGIPDLEGIWALQVTTDGEAFVFIARDRAERDLWLRELSLAVELSRTLGLRVFAARHSATSAPSTRRARFRKGLPVPVAPSCTNCKNNFSVFGGRRTMCENCGLDYCRRCCSDQAKILGLKARAPTAGKGRDGKQAAVSTPAAAAVSASRGSNSSIASTASSGASSTVVQARRGVKVYVCDRCIRAIQTRAQEKLRGLSRLMRLAPENEAVTGRADAAYSVG